MKKAIIDLAKRVESKDPPIVVRPNLPSDLAGFISVHDLIQREVDRKTQFPFQRELALYLLLIASLWPGNTDRLVVAARIFAGALNFRIAGSGKHSRLMKRLSAAYPTSELAVFNRRFFSRIGGPESLLLCPSTEEFHREIWAYINELAMMHDVIEFLIKTADFPKLCSARMAFAAIAGDVFKRKGGYGVPSGSKRKHLPGYVATVETVRTRWRAAADTIILSFVLTRWCGIHYFDPINPSFFLHLNQSVEFGSREKLTNLLSIVQHRLRLGKAKQNSSIVRWLQPEMRRLQKQLHFRPLTESEFDRVIKIRNTDRQFKTRLTAEQEAEMRNHLQTWWPQIPRFQHMTTDVPLRVTSNKGSAVPKWPRAKTPNAKLPPAPK